MKTMVINGMKFQMSVGGETFLKKYLKKMESYIRENGIEMEVYDDMEERVAEKLNDNISSKSKREISDKVVIDIVNELGEPDEIFADMIEGGDTGGKEGKSFKDYFSNKNGELTRNSEEGIVFGVCYGIGKKFDIDPLWIRLIFVLGMFMGGMTLVFYIVLAILLPNESDLKKKSQLLDKKELKKDLKKTFKKGKEAIVALDDKAMKELKYVKEKGPSLLKRIFSFLLQILRIFIVILLVLFTVPAVIALLILSGMLFSSLSVDNQLIFEYVDFLLKIGVVGFIFSAVVFVGGVISALLKGRFLSVALIITGFIGLLVFVFIGSIGAFSTLENFKNNYTQEDLLGLEQKFAHEFEIFTCDEEKNETKN